MAGGARPHACSGAAVAAQHPAAHARIFVQELVNGLTQGSLYALIALGYSMVYGILKLLNFAHGDLYMVGAFVGYFVIQWFGGSHRAGDPGAAAAAVHVPARRRRRRDARRRDRALRLPAVTRRASDRAADHGARRLVPAREQRCCCCSAPRTATTTRRPSSRSRPGIHIGVLNISLVADPGHRAERDPDDRPATARRPHQARQADARRRGGPRGGRDARRSTSTTRSR